ncbi:MAG: PKD domain-containing protein [Bacteroidota bacterium]
MRFLKLYIILIGLSICSNAYSTTVPGTVASSATVCANNNMGTLNLTGNVGTVVRWEYSLNGFSLWTPIINTSNSYTYINLSQNTWFRVIVQEVSSFAASSNTVMIKTDNPSVGGIASVLSATECTGNNVKMNVSGYSGSILNWQYSLNNGVVWNTMPTSNDSISKYYSNITANTLFKATIKSGVCPLTSSDSVKVTVAPLSDGGIAAANATVCSGTNSNTITVSGYTGNVTRWESSPTGSGPWTSISNTTVTLAYNNLINNTYYRAILKSGNCAEAPSAMVFIQADAITAGGFVNGTQNVCSTLNNGILNLNGNNGVILQWEYSTNGGGSWTTTAVNTSTYTFTNLAANTLYKVQVKNGVCPPAYSNTLQVNVNPLPVVNYSFTPGCQGKSMNFTNTSVGSNLYSWDFKDGGNSTITNPSHTYLNDGTYPVKLTATSTNGCVDSISKSVLVYAKPNVGFISVDSTCGVNQVTFTNNSGIASGSITSYTWNFGDNSALNNTTSPNHMYVTANTYVVKLVATSNFGCKDSTTKPIQIFPKPSAGFSTNNVCKKTAASFINTSFINGGGILYSWDFGDAGTSTLTSPTHSYSASGNYSVSLITTSNHGCKDTIIKPIRINEQPDLSFSANNVCLTKTTVFTQTITPAISTYTLNWNLGDGNYLTGNNPTYTYLAAGNYQVTSTLTTDSGCVSTFIKIMNVYPLPNVAFNFNNVCSSDSAAMINLSSVTAGSISYNWDFGNSTGSTAISPKVKYAAAGTYPIKLIVTTNNACKDSLTKPITIFDAPVTSFNFTNPCDGHPVQFNNTSSVTSGVIANNNWNFGDNTNSTLVNPTKQYLNFGTFTVTLIATSSNGCTNSLTKTLNVYEGAVANFSFVNQCLNIAIPFTNSSTIGTGTFGSNWNFGDTLFSTLNSPTHLYTFPGTKKVSLKVTTNNGCTDSISKFVQAYEIPTIHAGKDTAISRGYGILLNASGGTSYFWSPATGLNNPTIANPLANPELTTTYIVEGTSGNGCTNYDTVIVTVDDNFLVIPYNIITPNGNGKNDVWFVKNIENYPQNKVIIMDEWGLIVYEKSGYNNNWDGKNKKGEILPDGTYFYVLTFEENKKVYKGFIALLRNK